MKFHEDVIQSLIGNLLELNGLEWEKLGSKMVSGMCNGIDPFGNQTRLAHAV